jgi:hypothetical protein
MVIKNPNSLPSLWPRKEMYVSYIYIYIYVYIHLFGSILLCAFIVRLINGQGGLADLLPLRGGVG